eukprot:CAMPEP_0194479128 /NCGR_PEP_ID=MMETSP0253-20130528/2348_1 /TAXON_ID=2966 /ORGANISM="Noctiluca scintillans" /LENGTH=344 /DNA_ID=CAMNT_0039318305 /DNA_START=49 /DNA_END=1083 /DNA_ORIENTATION=+
MASRGQLEALRGSYGEACDLAESLERSIQQAQLHALSLRASLWNAGVHDGASLIPGSVRSGGQQDSAAELKTLLEWLAERVNLSEETAYHTEGEWTIGAHCIEWGRMVTWSLTGVSQKLSVPADFRDEVIRLLVSTRTRGKVNDAEVQKFALQWSLLGVDVVTNGETVPAIFLINEEVSSTVIVADWPVVEQQPPQRPSLDLQHHFSHHFSHFSSVETAVNMQGVAWPSVPSPRRMAGPAPLPKASPVSVLERCVSVRHVTEADLRDPPVHVSEGDRVEVKFDGQWFSGVVQRVHGNVAKVQCDADTLGTITIAPLLLIRPAQSMGQPSHNDRVEDGMVDRSAA